MSSVAEYNTQNMQNTQLSREELQYRLRGRINNMERIRQGYNSDFDLAGTLENYRNLGFTLLNCVEETIDNTIDSGSTKVRIYVIYHEAHDKSYYVIAGNGAGLDKQQLMSIQKLQQRKNASRKNGRFGFGAAVSRSVLTENKGSAIMLSNHKSVPENQRDDPFATDCYAQIVVDLARSMEEGRLVKEPSDEISRRYAPLWNKFAIDKFEPGVVLLFELTDEMRERLLHDFTNADRPHRNIKLAIARDYREFDVEFKVNDEIVEPLPYPTPENSMVIRKQLWLVEPISDEVFESLRVKPTDFKVREIVQFDSDENGNRLDDTAVVLYKNRQRHCKPIDIEDITLKHKILDSEHYLIKSIPQYFNRNAEFFESLGFTVANRDIPDVLKIQIVNDGIFRNSKFIALDTDPEKAKGDGKGGKHRGRKDVINIFKLYNELTQEQLNEQDNLININVNKSLIKRDSCHDDINYWLSYVKTSNMTYYWNNYFRPRHEAVLAEAAAQLQAEQVEVGAEEEESDEESDEEVPVQQNNQHQEEDEEDGEEPVSDEEEEEEEEEEEVSVQQNDQPQEEDVPEINTNNGTQTIPAHERRNSNDLTNILNIFDKIKNNPERWSDEDKDRMVDGTNNFTGLKSIAHNIIRSVYGANADLVIDMINRHDSGLDELTNYLVTNIKLYERYYANRSSTTVINAAEITRIWEIMAPRMTEQ